MKLNPEYKKWQEAQNGGAPATSVANSDVALPVVSSMEDHMKLNSDLGQEIPLSESTNATIEMMQEPEISLEAGMQPDDMVDALGSILAKYEVPMGLMNKVRTETGVVVYSSCFYYDQRRTAHAFDEKISLSYWIFSLY